MKREVVRCCIEEVVSGPRAAAMRERAGRCKTKASAALSDDGSSEKDTQDFVDAMLSSVSTGAASDGSARFSGCVRKRSGDRLQGDEPRRSTAVSRHGVAASSCHATPPVSSVSLPLQGHVTPLLVLGRRLASRGLLVTFTTVPLPGIVKNFAHELGDGGAVPLRAAPHRRRAVGPGRPALLRLRRRRGAPPGRRRPGGRSRS
ncbi:hypothetical protein PR202_gb05161 [Eleusine coracana subsp. coracana]|uniref:Uncharacterized protein n=1 Tax=Eleusine coracana subsp. coracana TaxID=191504 RepID=A0AAV5E3V9_ELECO|nr:hypothetical protein PR202_gb05161 [Eleusine coracana subsp. coracana]